jgi:ABC-2 type transport system permease protein
VNYLCEDDGLLNVRKKEFKTRLLDQSKIDEKRYYWQILNTSVPVGFVIIIGMIFFVWRKRKFEK